MDRLKVLFVAAEAAPFVKVGGLGDVAGTLPGALRALPEAPDVRLVLPLHRAIDRAAYDLKPVAAFEVAHSYAPIRAEAYETTLDGLPVYLIDGAPFADEPQVYTADAAHDGDRYVFFSLAALGLARALDWQPDVLHAHDWHVAPAVYALKLRSARTPFFQDTRSLLTVHNLPYQGQGADSALEAYGLPPAYESDLPEWAKQTPLAVGLWAADHINTVSPGYAAEMQTVSFGAGLDGFLRSHAAKVSGILNGLDVEAWNPATDDALTVRFDHDSLDERVKHKAALRAALSLPDDDVPLLTIISRMDHQKGIDTALEALRGLEQHAWQAVILGTGDAEIENSARALAEAFPERVRALIRFDGELARRLYASADMIVIPSRYEPCGLTQMIAMRYGCVPVARAVGGLKDTIADFDGESGTGFLYADESPEALAEAILRALETNTRKAAWRGLQQRGMANDFSWRASAEDYLRLYHTLAAD